MPDDGMLGERVRSASLTAGSPVMILSQTTGTSYEATVRDWEVGHDGLTVAATLRVASSVAEELADHRVWVKVAGTDDGKVSGAEPVDGAADSRGVTVFGGIAHWSGSDVVAITGVAPLVRERRRQSPRASSGAEVTLSSPQHTVVQKLRAVDLCREAVRVALAEGRLELGEHVAVRVDLGNGDLVPARGEVTRIDRTHGYAVVRFDGLDANQGARIDRYVLFRLARPS